MESNIGVHSMLYLNTPSSAKRAMFAQASYLGASIIRLDIELSGVFVNSLDKPDWSGVDEYMALAKEYKLEVLADLTATPYYMAQCPPGTPSNKTYMCPPADPQAWADAAMQIAAHTRGVINFFEIINEPDGRWGFLGTPYQYAGILSAAYPAIKQGNPDAKVVLGGIMHPGAYGREYLDHVFAGAPFVSRKFDIANVHLRVPLDDLGPAVRAWQAYFKRQRKACPLWVTETGYPANPAAQIYSGYTGGPQSQAEWMTRAIQIMRANGVKKVFVTERDLDTSPLYASEGVLQTLDPLPPHPTIIRRPSFYAVHGIAKGWKNEAQI